MKQPRTFDNDTKWLIQSVPFTCRLGELQIAKPVLRLARDAQHFLKRHTSSSQLNLSSYRLSEVPGPVHGLFIQTYTLPLPNRRIWLGRDPDNVRAIYYVPRRYPRYVTDLKMTAEVYEEQLSGKTRSTIRRKVRKLESQSGGKLDFTVARTMKEILDLYDEALPLSQMTYQHVMLRAGLPDTAEFRERLLTLASQDRVRGYLLRLNGEAVAYLVCPEEGSALMFDYVGYHPNYAKLSPGTVLQWLALKDMMQERKFSWFDFTPGYSQYKETFSTMVVDGADVYILRFSPRTASVCLLHSVVELSSSWIGSWLSRLGLKRTLRVALRSAGALRPGRKQLKD